MGCNHSKDTFGGQKSSCWKEENVTKSISSSNYNEVEVDLTHFEIAHCTIGLGGFGIVREVTKLSGSDKGYRYAMKSMGKAAILKRSSGPACVNTELKALILLSGCDFVCNIRYAFQDQSQLHMVLDLASGGDMRFNLRSTISSRFSESVAKTFIAQIFIALDHCHRSSILHRDVKPENILMTDRGHLKLSDFGVAKILPDIQDCRSTSGTHGYMAPEIYMTDHVHGTTAEWFAVGITLHEFLTGRRPFEVQRLQAFRGHTLRSASAANEQCIMLPLNFLDSCSYLSDSCKDFVRGLLEPNKNCRLGSSGGLASIRDHSWFNDIDWSCIENRSCGTPYCPDVSHRRSEVNEEELQKVLRAQAEAPPLSEQEQRVFQHYEYRTNMLKTADSETAVAVCTTDEVRAHSHSEARHHSKKRIVQTESRAMVVSDHFDSTEGRKIQHRDGQKGSRHRTLAGDCWSSHWVGESSDASSSSLDRGFRQSSSARPSNSENCSLASQKHCQSPHSAQHCAERRQKLPSQQSSSRRLKRSSHDVAAWSEAIALVAVNSRTTKPPVGINRDLRIVARAEKRGNVHRGPLLSVPRNDYGCETKEEPTGSQFPPHYRPSVTSNIDISAAVLCAVSPDGR